MLQRLVTGDPTTFCAIVAFVFAAAIFVTISWCALRMKRPQVEHFANLPFGPEFRPSQSEAETRRVEASASAESYGATGRVQRAKTGLQP